MEHPLAISHRSSSSLRPRMSHSLKSTQIPPVLDFPDTSPQVPHWKGSPQTNPSPTFTDCSLHIEALRQTTEFTLVAGYPSYIEPIAVVAVVAHFGYSSYTEPIAVVAAVIHFCYPSHIEPIAVVAVVTQHHAAFGHAARLLLVGGKHCCHWSYAGHKLPPLVKYALIGHMLALVTGEKLHSQSKSSAPCKYFCQPNHFSPNHFTCQQQI